METNRAWLVALMMTVACGPAADGGFGDPTDDGGTANETSSTSSTTTSESSARSSATSASTSGSSSSTSSTSSTSATTATTTTSATTTTTTTSAASTSTSSASACSVAPASTQTYCQTKFPVIWQGCTTSPGPWCQPLGGVDRWCCSCDATNNVPNYAACAAY